MKYMELIMTQGNNAKEALEMLNQQLKKDYADKQCKLANLFLLPEAIQVGTVAGPNGQPQMKVITTLVAVIEEEPELDNLQRQYKAVFDYLNNNAADFTKILVSFLQSVNGSIPPVATQ